MKLTPLDIHHKEFRRSIRGYNEEEVDVFLDQVAEDFERLFKENIDLKEQVESMQEKVKQYEGVESTLQKALFTAQRAADEVQSNAEKESELIIKDAELKSKEIIQNIIADKQKLKDELERLRERENEFRHQFKDMLKDYLKAVDEQAKEDEETVEPQEEPAAEVETVEPPQSQPEPPKAEEEPRRLEAQPPIVAAPEPQPVEPTVPPKIDTVADAIREAQSVSDQEPAVAPPVLSEPAPLDQLTTFGDFGMRAPDVGSPREANPADEPSAPGLLGPAEPAGTELKVMLDEPAFGMPSIPQPQGLPEVVSSFFDDDLGVDEEERQAKPSSEPSAPAEYLQTRPMGSGDGRPSESE
jgi:cell division initiation protein